MNVIAAITCTGGRPAALTRCLYYMARQLEAPDVWYIIDDVGDADATVDAFLGAQIDCETWAQIDHETFPGSWMLDRLQIVRTRHHWKAGGPHTLGMNVKTGIEAVTAEFGENPAALVFIEDDDWYAFDYLLTMRKEAERCAADLVGEPRARYFNVATGRGHLMPNTEHCSLMSTMVKGNGVRHLWQMLDADPLQLALDIRLWRGALIKRMLRSHLTCGIKGLPGRPGIGIGHGEGFGDPDSDWSMLVDWIGEDDANWYKRFNEVTLA